LDKYEDRATLLFKSADADMLGYSMRREWRVEVFVGEGEWVVEAQKGRKKRNGLGIFQST